MLSPKQAHFISEYLKDSNATRSYIAAGYSKKGAEVSASKLLRNANVQKELQKRFELTRQQSRITSLSLIDDAEKVKQRCMQGTPVRDREGSPTGEWKFDARSVLGAIKLQAELLGLLGNNRTDEDDDDILDGQSIDLSAATSIELVEALLTKENPNGLQIPRAREVVPLPSRAEAAHAAPAASAPANHAAKPDGSTDPRLSKRG